MIAPAPLVGIPHAGLPLSHVRPSDYSLPSRFTLNVCRCSNYLFGSGLFVSAPLFGIRLIVGNGGTTKPHLLAKWLTWQDWPRCLL